MARPHITIIGAPLDLGAGRRGVDMGPSALRVANLNGRIASLGYDVEDLGNVAVDQPESLPAGPQRARYLPQIAQTCLRLARLVRKTADRGRMPLLRRVSDHTLDRDCGTIGASPTGGWRCLHSDGG